MALWVDDVSEVSECDETDNVEFGRDEVEFRFNLPDIAIENWWASWDDSGRGRLEYRVVNKGTRTITGTDWDINLVLHTLPYPNDVDGTVYYLFYEEAGPVRCNRTRRSSADLTTQPISTFSVTHSSQEFRRASTTCRCGSTISIGYARTTNGTMCPSGRERITLGSPTRTRNTPSTVLGAPLGLEPTVTRTEPGSAFNGKVLPEQLWRKVEIVELKDGARELLFLSKPTPPDPSGTTIGAPESEMSDVAGYHEKSNQSNDVLVFPRADVLRMP